MKEITSHREESKFVEYFLENDSTVPYSFVNSLFHQKFITVVLSRLSLKSNTIKKRSAIFKSNDFLLLNNQHILVDTLLIDRIQKEAEVYLNLNK